jgi:hypothetical protein
VALCGISGLYTFAHEDVDPHFFLLLSGEEEQVSVLGQEVDVPSVLGLVPVVLAFLQIAFF